MKKLGEHLVEGGILTRAQLSAALLRQRALSVGGAPVRLGEVLVEMGLLSGNELRRALQRQESQRTEEVSTATDD
jgi:hypothetical protein